MNLITTEKAVRLIELSNTLVINVDKRLNKKQIKKEFETIFNVKTVTINTLIKDNKKIAYIKLDEKNPAIDIATKLGMI